MKIIEIRPSKKFDGSWSAYEGPGVSPCYPGPQSKQFAIDYARNTRFGCTSGESHVYDDTGKTVAEVIKIDARDLSGRLMTSGPDAAK
jgi:hypothetical protein